MSGSWSNEIVVFLREWCPIIVRFGPRLGRFNNLAKQCLPDCRCDFWWKFVSFQSEVSSAPFCDLKLIPCHVYSSNLSEHVSLKNGSIAVHQHRWRNKDVLKYFCRIWNKCEHAANAYDNKGCHSERYSEAFPPKQKEADGPFSFPPDV